MRSPLPMLALLAAAACTRGNAPAAVVDAGAPLTYQELLRIDFNARAQEVGLPLFWRSDANGDKRLSPDELAVLVAPGGQAGSWLLAGGFSPAFDATYRSLQVLPDFAGLPDAEARRRSLLREELRQGRPTLVETDVRGWSDEERAVLGHLLEVAPAVERLYARQKGTLELASRVLPDDRFGQALFLRNQGPWCEAPRTGRDPGCSAVPGGPPPRVSGLYPADLQADGGAGFCELLVREPNGAALAQDHFSVVERADGGFRNVPFTVAWKGDMEAVARGLEAAAAAVSSPGEAAFKAYLGAAAAAFRSNDWEPADRAWVAMGASSSRWYVRVAPDEVYFEPCGWKGGFALQLGRINLASQVWQKRLEPLKGELEKAMAAAAGAPYRAREVKFRLPDFVDVVLNAGDQRNAHGATVGQSLPNWGPVAASGGRTTVMTNLYTDDDSVKQQRVLMKAVFCPATIAAATLSPEPGLMSTVLHEAAHNLGPAHDYAVGGKRSPEVFGGSLASTLEELKAETAALRFTGWLRDRKVIDPTFAGQGHVAGVAWAVNQISKGLHGADGAPSTYPQLASIELGWLHRAGVLTWKQDAKAANDFDQGCLELELGPRLDAALQALLAQVAGMMARGDAKAARALVADFVDAPGEWKTVRDTVATRWLQAPQATFVYAIRR